MSDLPSFGGDMFKNMMNDLMRLLPAAGGGVPWEVGYQLAAQIAAGEAGAEPNADPLERIRFEELSAVAALHVGDVTGMSLVPGGGKVALVPSTRGEWARRALDTWRPVLDRLAAVVEPPEIETAEQDDPMMAMLGRWMTAMFPMMTAMQVGSVAGHLAERAIGQYDVPLAAVASHHLLVVAGNLAGVAEDWSLPADDLRLWLCAHELACHAVLSRPGVAGRIADLVVAHARLAQPDADAVRRMLEGADPTDPMAVTELFSDPSAFVPAAKSGVLEAIRGDLDAITAAVSGYTEHVTTVISDRLIGNHTPIGEAMRRRRVSRGEGEKVAEALFGLSLDQPQIDRGAHFVAGVIERGGADQLAAMWSEPALLPTPAEISAPGLWLARIALPPDSPPGDRHDVEGSPPGGDEP